MRTNSDVLKQDLRKSIDNLKKLGTEIREDLREAGADARKQWKHFLEPQLENVETLARSVAAASHDAVSRTGEAFKAFQASIKATKGSPPRQRRRAVKRIH